MTHHRLAKRSPYRRSRPPLGLTSLSTSRSLPRSPSRPWSRSPREPSRGSEVPGPPSWSVLARLDVDVCSDAAAAAVATDPGAGDESFERSGPSEGAARRSASETQRTTSQRSSFLAIHSASREHLKKRRTRQSAFGRRSTVIVVVTASTVPVPVPLAVSFAVPLSSAVPRARRTSRSRRDCQPSSSSEARAGPAVSFDGQLERRARRDRGRLVHFVSLARW